jgi:membrane fusion protein, multidrug efflux system
MNTAEQNPATNSQQAIPLERNSPADNSGATDEPISAYPRRRSRKRWFMFAALVVLAVGGVFLWRYLSGFESTDDAQVDVHLYPVSARISGYIQKVNVDDNQWVDAGSTIVEIDPKDYEVALARAQATLDTSEATAKSSNIDVPISSIDTSSQLKFTSSDIKNAEAAIQAAEKQTAAAHARVLEAQAENVKAQDDVTRYRLLLTKEELPKQIYDHAYAAAATDVAAIAAAEADEAAAQQAVVEAHSRLTEAEARYEDAQAGRQRVGSTRAKALSATADVNQKRAAVEQAQLNLGYTRIIAPVSGEITKKVVVGLNVDPGEQLLTVTPLDQV